MKFIGKSTFWILGVVAIFIVVPGIIGRLDRPVTTKSASSEPSTFINHQHSAGPTDNQTATRAKRLASELPDVPSRNHIVRNDQKNLEPSPIINIGADISVDDFFSEEDSLTNPINIGQAVDVDDYSEVDQSASQIINIGDDFDAERELPSIANEPLASANIGPDIDINESEQQRYEESNLVDLGVDILAEGGSE